MHVLVITPTYNERDNLPDLARAVLAREGYRIMVVDDNSPDGTGEVADALAREFPGRVEVLHRTGPRGLGRSYIDGIRRAIDGPADVICQMDADWSHDPQYLPTLVAATATHDVVIGSRYLNGVSVVNWPLQRIILSALANRYIRAVTRLQPSDCTSGYRCWRRETLASLPLGRVVSEGYAFLVEMLFQAAEHGASIGEVPIIFVERRKGVSKLSGSVILESMLTPWRLVWRRLVRETTGCARVGHCSGAHERLARLGLLPSAALHQWCAAPAEDPEPLIGMSRGLIGRNPHADITCFQARWSIRVLAIQFWVAAGDDGRTRWSEVLA